MIGVEPIEIPVLAFGKGWLVVDKPAGVSVHNESGRDLCSLAAALIQNDKSTEGQVGMDPDFGVSPVHRLDKETSGVILLALNREMFRFFSKQFESRRVNKRYVALLHGLLENREGRDPWGTWNWALAKNAGGRDNPEGSGQRQESLTRYRVLDRSTHYTMVEIELLSGRTHQIPAPCEAIRSSRSRRRSLRLKTGHRLSQTQSRIRPPCAARSLANTILPRRKRTEDHRNPGDSYPDAGAVSKRYACSGAVMMSYLRCLPL